MKRTALCFLMLLSLCGCGLLRHTTYISVQPHNEDYGVSTDSNVLTVSSYLSLKNAILNMVQDSVDSGVIRAESYAGELPTDLSQAVYEVTQMTPLGAYAVASMTYDYSRIVGYYEIHLNTVFRRTPEEIRSVRFVADAASVTGYIQRALEERQERLVLRVGDYSPLDPNAVAETYWLEHPASMLEQPEITMEQYPDSGSQRILDIRFAYEHSPEELEDCADRLARQVEDLAARYSCPNSVYTTVRLIYDRLGRDAVLEQTEEGGSLSSSAYGALVEGRADSLGYAQAFDLLMEAFGVPCQVVGGQKNGSSYSWCMIELDGRSLYVDPGASAGAETYPWFLMGDRELVQGGYVIYHAADYPEAILPAVLRPAMSPPYP